MKKYWLIVKNTWDEYAAYRLNFIMWRLRQVLRFLILYFLWSTIYSGSQSYFGYNRQLMLTYVLLIYLVSNFVAATRTQDLGNIINEGRLTNHLLKPIGYFKVLAARDVSDKILNFIFTLIESGLLIFLLKPQLFIQTNIWLLLYTILAFGAGVLLYFYISILLGMIGFWTTEVWAARFIFFIIVEYFGGAYFPIDILPHLVTKILLITPFPYLFYFPVKIFLGQLQTVEIFIGLTLGLIWCLILAKIVQLVWQKGLRVYSAEGR